MSSDYKLAEIGIDPLVGIYNERLDLVVLPSVSAQREADAEDEAQARADAEETALGASLDAAKKRESSTIDWIRTNLVNQQPLLLDEDFAALRERFSDAEQTVLDANSHIELKNALLQLARIKTDIDRAVWRKSELTTHPNDPVPRRVPDTRLTSSEEHELKIGLGEQAVSEAEAIVAGLRADPIIVRWAASDVDDLVLELNKVATLAERDQVDRAAMIIKYARNTSERIVKAASDRQIVADQRDYFVRCIGMTLEELGFFVGEAVDESPGDPATSKLIHAATSDGKAIVLSVSNNGKLCYMLHGYEQAENEGAALFGQVSSLLFSRFHVTTKPV